MLETMTKSALGQPADDTSQSCAAIATRSPLSAAAARAGSQSAVAVLPALAQISVRIPMDRAQETTLLGLDAGGRIGACVDGEQGRRVLRLGPDEWMVLGRRDERDAILSHLEAAVSLAGRSLVDISHRAVALSVSGPLARDILNSGCPLDLSAEAFPAGSATRTIFAKCEVILMHPGAGTHFELLVWRSFARYLHEHLIDSEKACAALQALNRRGA